jgi:hypothetical protein
MYIGEEEVLQLQGKLQRGCKYINDIMYVECTPAFDVKAGDINKVRTDS